jgi:Meiotically up-regulated gene 113
VPRDHEMTPAVREQIREQVRKSRMAQGLPPTIQDRSFLDQLASEVLDGGGGEGAGLVGEHETTATRREQIQAWAREEAARAPQLTESQKARLRVLLQPSEVPDEVPDEVLDQDRDAGHVTTQLPLARPAPVVDPALIPRPVSAPPPPPRTENWVYAIQAVSGGPVKIGRSVAPLGRLAHLQTTSPVQLEIIWQAPLEGNREGNRERFLHNFFAARRARGEWFDFGDEDPVAAIEAALGHRDNDRGAVEGRH